MNTRIFYPVSRGDFKDVLRSGQRYRHAFGDYRLFGIYKDMMDEMSDKQSIVIHQLSSNRSKVARFYRFVNNPKVGLSELIYESCRINEDLVNGKDLLVLQDGTSVGLRSKCKNKSKWGADIGVIDDNRTPGFYLHCSLVFDQARQYLIGLSDTIVYTRPFVKTNKKTNAAMRYQRRCLPIEQQESFVWPLGAVNSSDQLNTSRRLTYVMDQGGDKYEVFVKILDTTCGHFITRSKENRMAYKEEDATVKNRLSDWFEQENWVDKQNVSIRALNHYSKSSGRLVQRQARIAQLSLRYMKVQLERPSGYAAGKSELFCPVYVVEVKEHSSTVPVGEQPIHWRLLTSWPIENIDQAWQVVNSYQARWYIEQLFRVFKKQGLGIEYSQIKNPECIKKQAVMALKIATQAMQLTLARDGTPFIAIETMFDENQQHALKKLNQKLNGTTQKQTNPHADNSLAWAAWVIARLGGWKGYKSQRPPGPITMKRGLQDLEKFIWALEVINDT